MKYTIPEHSPADISAAYEHAQMRFHAMRLIYLVVMFILLYVSVWNGKEPRVKNQVSKEPLESPSDTDSRPFIEKPFRVIAIGDIHGDFKTAMLILKDIGIIDEKLDWAAGSNTFVQTGDIVDRGHDTIELYKFMMKLTKQASEAGGRVIALLGNHEIMNMMDDLRYVSERDINSFGSSAKRAAAWSKTGFIGKYLRTLDIAANVNGSVFVHAGINKYWANIGIDAINAQARIALDTMTPRQMYTNAPVLTAGDCPVWYRGYALEDEPEICFKLAEVLQILGAQRMIMGHTIQEDGKIHTRCIKNGVPRIFLIDVGMSSAYGTLGMAALEITHFMDGTVKTKALYMGTVKKI